MFVVFWFGAVCAIVTVGVAMMRTDEVEPTDEELAHIRTQSKGIGATVSEIAEAVKVMPIGMHKIGLAFLFQWYAMFIYWQFVSVSVAESVWNAAPDSPGYEEAAGWVGLMNGGYNFVTMISALFLLPLCHRYGGKRVHAGTLALAGLSLAALSTIDNQWMTLVPMIGLGICWASMVGVPYLMVASMVPRERTGVYMGILNMMIVVPMLIQTLTFGCIFENLLDDRGTNAILLGSLLVPLGHTIRTLSPPPLPVAEGERPKEPKISLGMLPLARRDVERLRHILQLQRRMTDLTLTPKARRALMHRGPFQEALTWLELHGDHPEALEHWRGFLEAARTFEPPEGEGAEAPPTVERRRRRRRRRRPRLVSGS